MPTGDAKKIGWIYRRRNGYFRYCCTPTSDGLQQSLSWVEDLQQATVFYVKPTFRRMQDESITEAEIVPAIEMRTISLVEHRNKEK